MKSFRRFWQPSIILSYHSYSLYHFSASLKILTSNNSSLDLILEVITRSVVSLIHSAFFTVQLLAQKFHELQCKDTPHSAFRAERWGWKEKRGGRMRLVAFLSVRNLQNSILISFSPLCPQSVSALVTYALSIQTHIVNVRWVVIRTTLTDFFLF